MSAKSTLVNALIRAGTGAGLAFGYDKAFYNTGSGEWDSARKVNLMKNLLLGSLAGKNLIGSMEKGKFVRPTDMQQMFGAIEAGVLPPVIGSALEGVGALHKYKDQKIQSSSVPGALLAGGGLLTAAALVPALISINRAAKRIGDGRAIRLSTSLRKRPKQDQDLIIGVRDSREGADTANSEDLGIPLGNDIITGPNPPKRKRFLGIF